MRHIYNVLHLIDHYRIGGPGKTILNSHRFIDSHRYRLHLAVFSPLERVVQSELVLAAQKVGLPVLQLPDHRGINRTAAATLKQYLIEKEIHILHSHGYKTNWYNLIAKMYYPNLQCVSTYHGWITNNYRQNFYYFLDLLLSRFFDAVIPVSDAMRIRFPAHVRRKATTQTIHNAIVIADYSKRGLRPSIRKKHSLNDGDFVIGVVGRLSPEKGCREAIAAIEKASKIAPRIRLLIVGEGPQKSVLQDEVNKKALNHRVLFTGYQHPVQPYFEAIDALLCPSFTEGISNVILEAMAYRLPVIATAVGGNPEIITDGEDGILIPPGSPEKWAAILLRLTESNSLRKKLSNNAFKKVSSKFDFAYRMDKMQSLYSRLLSPSMNDRMRSYLGNKSI
jgi:glycosyltransferase involved in cell wall biosynthesis